MFFSCVPTVKGVKDYVTCRIKALNLFHQVYGPLHADIATCYRYNSYFSVVKSTATYFIWCKIGRDLKGIYCYITKACLIFKWKCCDSF